MECERTPLTAGRPFLFYIGKFSGLSYRIKALRQGERFIVVENDDVKLLK